MATPSQHTPNTPSSETQLSKNPTNDSTGHSSNENQGVIHYGVDKIPYQVVFKDNARKLRLKVHPDMRVVITAPKGTPNETIEALVKKRTRWIWNHLQDFAKQQTDVLPRRYVSGETQFYLGRRYMLKVIHDSEQTDQVKLIKGKLTISLTNDISDQSTDIHAQSTKVQSLLDDWYKAKAKVIFKERLEAVLPLVNWVDDLPSFKILSMQKQWGSCSAQGNLVLNPHLVKAPKECIDYVILHELCHIAEHNHSEQFWRLLTQVMPHWKAVKTQLDSMAELYLNE